MLLSLKDFLFFYQVLIGIGITIGYQNHEYFNLIALDRTLSILPFSQTPVLYQQSCLGKCLYDGQCMSLEVHVSANNIECKLFNITYEMYKTVQAMQLVEQQYTKFFSKHFFKKDCTGWYKDGARTNGVYEIMILGRFKKSVYCNMEGEGGGWLVFQNRFDGSVSFEDKTWEEYKNGFGSPVGELWLGNEWLHLLTSSEPHDLYVEATSFGNEKKTKRFGGFTIGPESSNYIFNYVSIFDGYSIYDLFKYTTGLPFTTLDADNDNFNGANCAIRISGGWWYSGCATDPVNGKYRNQEALPSGDDTRGITWHSWKGQINSLKKISLMIRPSSY